MTKSAIALALQDKRHRVWAFDVSDEKHDDPLYATQGRCRAAFFGEPERELSVAWFASPLFYGAYADATPGYNIRVCFLVDQVIEPARWTFVLEASNGPGSEGTECYAPRGEGNSDSVRWFGLRETFSLDQATDDSLLRLQYRWDTSPPMSRIGTIKIPPRGCRDDLPWTKFFSERDDSSYWSQITKLTIGWGEVPSGSLIMPEVALATANVELSTRQVDANAPTLRTSSNPVYLSAHWREHLTERQRWSVRAPWPPTLAASETVERKVTVDWSASPAGRAYPLQFEWGQPLPTNTRLDANELSIEILSPEALVRWTHRGVGPPSADHSLDDYRLSIHGPIASGPLKGRLLLRSELPTRRHREAHRLGLPARVHGLLVAHNEAAKLNKSLKLSRLEFDRQGLAAATIETEVPYDQGAAFILSAQPVYVVRVQSSEIVPGGRELAYWTGDHWRFADRDGLVEWTLQASGLWEPLVDDRPPPDNPSVRLGKPVAARVNQRGNTGPTNMPLLFTSFSAIMGARLDLPNGPDLDSLRLEVIDGLDIEVLAEPRLKLSEIAGIDGDLVLLDERDKFRLFDDTTWRQYKRLLYRAAVFQPWVDRPDAAPTLRNVRAIVAPAEAAAAWAHVLHAVPPMFRDLLAVEGSGQVENLAVSHLGATGLFKTTFAGGKVAIEIRLLVGRIMRYRVEIAGRFACVGNLASYVATYERSLEDAIGWIRRVERRIEVTQRSRFIDAGPVQTFVAAENYELKRSEDTGALHEQFWILELEQATSEAVLCVVPSEKTNERNAGLQSPPTTRPVSCQFVRPHFMASIDPADSPNPDNWNPLDGYDLASADPSLTQLSLFLPKDVILDFGHAHGVCLPIRLGEGGKNAMTLQLARGCRPPTPPSSHDAANESLQVLKGRLRARIEQETASLRVLLRGTDDHPTMLLYGLLSVRKARWPASPSLSFVVNVGATRAAAPLAAALRGQQPGTTELAQLCAELQAVANQDPALRRFTAALKEWAEAAVRADEPPHRLVRRLRNLLVRPWIRPTELQQAAEPLEQWAYGDMNRPLEDLLLPHGALDFLRLLQETGENVSRAVPTDLTDLALAALADGEAISARIERVLGYALTRADQLTTATCCVAPALHRVVKVEGPIVVPFLGAAPTTMKELVLAELEHRGWKPIDLGLQQAKLSGDKLPQAAGALFAGARSVDGDLVLKSAENAIAATLKDLKLGPFMVPALEDLVLKPSYEPSTRQVTLTGTGSKPLGTLGAAPVVLMDAVCTYHAVGALRGSGNTATQGLQLSLDVGLRGTLQLGQGDFLVRVRDFGLNVDERGTLDVSLDPAKIELPGLLEKINEALASATGGKCKIEQTPDGVRGAFNHSIPSLGAPGSVQVSNLALGASVELKSAGELTLEIKASLASRERPFAVVYSGLGGVGWFTTSITISKLLAKPAIDLSFDVGLGVGASVDLDLGVLKGSALIALSVDAKLGTSGSFAFGAQLLIHGEVDVLGLIQASITLILRAVYDGRTVKATGTFSLEIRLFFFSLKVNESVEYELDSPIKTSATLTETNPNGANRKALATESPRAEPIAKLLETYLASIWGKAANP
jgi:hypothetical protein